MILKVIIRVIIILLCTNFYVYGHDLQNTIKSQNAVVIYLYFPDGTKFSYESFEIYRPNEKIPFQVGRTDALGRVIFIPDKKGKWFVKAFSEDGHGVNLYVDINNENFSDLREERPIYQRYLKVFIGIGIIFGIFGIISIFKGGKNK